MTSLTSRIKALRDVCEGVLHADSDRTKGEWKRDPATNPRMQVIAVGNEVVSYHNQHARQRDERVVPNHKYICIAVNLSPQFARATLKTLDWLTGDLDHARECGNIDEVPAFLYRIESILSEFGI